MKDSFERRQRLQEAFPEASASALEYLPETFDQDAGKARAFFRTSPAAEDLASMLSKRVRELGQRYREPFPGMVGPGFDELGLKYAGDFLARVRRAASIDGRVSKEDLYSAFDDQIEAVRSLAREVRARHLAAEVEALSERSNRPRSR